MKGDTQSSELVLVTGANGHVGYTLVRKLLERGYRVRVTVRDKTDTEKTKWLKDLDVEICSLDIMDLDQFIEVTKDVVGLFHVAAVFKFGLPDPEETIIKPTVKGAVNAIRAAHENNVKRVVLTSSAVALGIHATKDQPQDETDWNRETKVPYQIAKTRAEEKAWELAEELDVDLVTINPSLILGPYFKTLSSSTSIIREIVEGKIPVKTPLVFNVTDVREVVEAHIRAYESGEAHGRYIVARTEPSTLEEIIEIMHELDESIKVPSLGINRFLFIWYARITSFVARLFGKIPQITTQQAKEYTIESGWYDLSKTTEELGIHPRDLKDILQDTLDWYNGEFTGQDQLLPTV